ncbi:MAG: radical SAM protein [Wolbachia sp.]
MGNSKLISLLEDVPKIKKHFEENSPKKNIIKPFWSHLQPFTRCNQKCIHCYCKGGTKADPFLLSIEQWKCIIERLGGYGIFDIYITGGENLMFPQFFELASIILSKNLGFGLSTNASIITSTVVSKLRELNIKKIQVSLDGATSKTYEFIRGASLGSFNRSVLKGIRKLTEIAEVVINTVVNKLNFPELKDIITIGQSFGVKKFKFFPQKNCGRSKGYSDIILSDREIIDVLIPECERLAKQYSTKIETIGSGNCGSGISGFAIEQKGDIYPCIFGVSDKTQCMGNILSDSLDDVWFNSVKLDKFRKLDEGRLCHRCETPMSLFG